MATGTGPGRGRPPLMAEDAIDLPALPSDPLTPIDRRTVRVDRR